MIFRKDMLSIYLKRILTQNDWNDTFLQYLSQVGRMHARKHDIKSLNVDYIHVNLLLGYLEHTLLDIIWDSEDIENKIKHEMILAINKVFWIQNDFFTKHYLSNAEDDRPHNASSKKKTSSCCLLH